MARCLATACFLFGLSGPAFADAGSDAAAQVVPRAPGPLPVEAPPPAVATPAPADTRLISVGILPPISGALSFVYGGAVGGRLLLAWEVSYFDRYWTLFGTLKDDEFRSQTLYLGTMLMYYPFAAPNEFLGFCLAADVVLSASYATYKPAGQSKLFFVPAFDFYFLSGTIRLHRELRLHILFGGGYAPTSQIVKFEGYHHDGDVYPIGDIQLMYMF